MQQTLIRNSSAFAVSGEIRSIPCDGGRSALSNCEDNPEFPTPFQYSRNEGPSGRQNVQGEHVAGGRGLGDVQEEEAAQEEAEQEEAGQGQKLLEQ